MLVATPPRGGPADDALVALLRAWLPARRWFPAKTGRAEVGLAGILTFPGDPAGERLRVALVRVRARGVDAVLQVPLAFGPGPGAVLGVLDGTTVRGGVGDPEFLRAWLAAAEGPGAGVDPDGARVMTGEQSNTSVVLPGPGSTRPVAILKVLRTIADGPNPDVDVPRRLVEVGWDGVPVPLGWLVGRWTGPDGATAEGYLGVMSAFVPEAEDGFELACRHAREHVAFDDDAARLGTLVADMHAALVRGFGTVPADGGAGLVAAQVGDRFAWAASQVPALEELRGAVEGVLTELQAVPGAPRRQRVHGDLHLGQVLRSGTRWYVTDFEGEPLAPLAERTRPDFAVRDVAGLLRSFDYAAAVGGLRGDDASSWSGRARRAALLAYDEAAGTTLADGTGAAGSLLRALELDKALYEAVYEQRNRPDWLAIPLAGLHRLLG
ncbi:MAG: aminoglycoside phosphotransferase [Cellulomonas sp. 73-92]|uniref:maltokinase N-terminal cap-like domain-containing protein n=1 Tax=Cellulomonas sp. 73-92 TaxID=1895740 RepID=UPI000928373E|nr:aminoglycoside phosphotransferase [Cellulomonas sp. 73-92]OJV79023.1 MAG: aminoglycoside phosphotransferase [Cellulomonas sp. 73-92]